MISGCSVGTHAPAPVPELPGEVELNRGPSTDIPPGGGGSGTVDFRGRIYRFAIGGDGVDGSAIAILQTTGEVYHLTDIAQFAGRYRRTNDTPGAAGQSGGGLWLSNQNGSILHLRPPPGGRMPNLSTDAVSIVLK